MSIFRTIVAVLVLCASFGAAMHTYERYHDDEIVPPSRFNTEPYDFSSNVISLTTDTFSKKLAEYPLALVLFHAPWSQSCQDMYPHLDSIAAALRQNDPKIYVAEVDLMKHPDVGKKYEIAGFPTMYIYRYGQLGTTGENRIPRDKDGIIRHMKSLVFPPAIEVNTIEEASNFVDADTLKPNPAKMKTQSLVVFGFLKGDFEKEVFTDVAQLHHQRFTFIFTTIPKVAKKFKHDLTNVAIYKGFDDGGSVTMMPKGSRKVEFTRPNLNEFVANNSIPLIGDFTAETRLLYVQKRQPMVVLFTHLNSTTSSYASAMVNVARIWTNVTFVFANPWENNRLFAFLDLDRFRGRYGYALAMLVGKQKYRFDNGKFTQEKLLSFVQAVDAGEIDEFKKTQPEFPFPQHGNGQVWELVYTNFKKVVDHPRLDTVVLFYNPKDRISQHLLETFRKLAKKYTGIKQLNFCIFNGLENDQVEGYETYAFPRILMTRRDRGPQYQEAVQYKGTRSIESLVSWVEKHTTIQLDRESQDEIDERDLL